MQRIILDAEVGRVSEELMRRGIAAASRVHVVAEVIEAPDLPVAALAEAGGDSRFWPTNLTLYSDSGLIERNR
jgi:hypothetical protein